MKQKQETREFGADVVRIAATFFIIGVHFFLHNGFYTQPQTGGFMLLADIVRWLTFSCVPLFLVLTGYLKSENSLTPSYYSGIMPIAATWALVSLICIAFRIGYQHEQQTPLQWLVLFLNYKGANYSWYIELYFGLFLICPFLNRIFAVGKMQYHRHLLLTMMAMVFIPATFNGIECAGGTLNLFPDYFVSLWPVAYYFTGCYIRRYKPQINKRPLALLLALLCVFKGALTYLTSEGGVFGDGIEGGYSNITVYAITVCVFLLLYQADTSSVKIKNIFSHISRRCLIIYLISSVFDAMAEPVSAPYMTPDKYPVVFWVQSIFVFGMSLLASEILYPLVLLLCGRKKGQTGMRGLLRRRQDRVFGRAKIFF